MNGLLIKARNASKALIKLSNYDRNLCLSNIKESLIENIKTILDANKIDVCNAIENNCAPSFVERLTLTESKLIDIANSIDEVRNLDDIIGVAIEEFERPNGLKIKKIREPFGVICSIFESRPNVVVDITVLCLKTANSCVLKGGKEAINTNKTIVNIMKNAISNIVDQNVITFIQSTDRATTDELITKNEYIDLLIPRGSKGLIRYICNNSKIPYIETGAGNCHLYVEKSANLDMAISIAINAKYQRPSVCNSIENILVDREIVDVFLPMLYNKFMDLKIEMRGCECACKIIPILKASNEDYYEEYNDYIVAIKVVDDYNEAISHINKHSSKHSESIISENMDAVTTFIRDVDSACIYHNASTRFSDGGEFGFGAEIGISTGKLHSRGPMGIKEITTYKYVVCGNGQVRK
jgi:glutamate-5-semialdehyde dehydrogenase